ncbi:hypothetical protein ACJZ2D_015646 [Fusarium nematophilum]
MITSDAQQAVGAIAAWVRADNVSPRTLLVYSSLALTALYVLFQIFTSPLRHIPGPFLNKFTNAVLTLNTLAGRRIHYVHKLHQQYGPVVRISGKDFTRSPVEDVFSTRNPKIHASRGRVLNAPLSPAALRANWEWLVRDKVQKAIAGIKRGAVHGPAGAYHWFTLMSSDIIGQISTGDDFHLVESGEKTGFFEDLESLNRVNTISSAHCKNVVDEIRERKGSKKTVFTDLINEEASTNDGAVAVEVLGLILAGSGTTAITLAYLVWAVLKRPDIQAKLENEVGQLEPGYSEAQLRELPYLNAVIKESLRLYTAIPGGLQRIVPPSAPLKAGGQTEPPGTTVVTQALKDEDMEFFNFFVVAPKGNKCLVTLQG